MTDELDLEKGDPSAAERILSEGQAASRSRRSTRSSKGGKSTTRKASTEAEDNSLRAKVQEMFGDFAQQFEQRDPELADILNRRKEAMAQGLISLTRTIRFLRGPLIVVVAFFQPTLAFWELGSVLLGRAIERRQRRAADREYQQAGVADVTDVTGNSVGDGYAS